jgi:predicted nucleic acid-binding protein
MSVLNTSDADLRYWLANEDWYMSRYTREWLQRTPSDEATDTLAAIAEDAVAEPRAPWAVMATVVASAGLATSDGIGGKGPGARKAGTRAALLLAERNDPRCIPPLVRVFSTGGFLQSKYQSQIESALLRVLSSQDMKQSLTPYAPDIRELVERIWKNGERRDLPAAQADLVIAAIHFLYNVSGTENTELVRGIASRHTANTARQPHRARVKQAAELLR